MELNSAKAATDIVYLKSDKNYISIYTADEKVSTLRQTLTQSLQQLPATFVQVHKSFVVNKLHVTKHTTTYVMLRNTKLPVGRVFRKNLQTHAAAAF